ncbi:uncharacterized protein O3Q21_013069 [Podargus strigoides]
MAALGCPVELSLGRIQPQCDSKLPTDVPKATKPWHDSDSPHRGSLCDRHCAAINNVQGDLGCHLHCPCVPAAMSPPSCCQQHSDEVCESCVAKTTPTAKNAMEANKLSNNYKFGFKKWKSHMTEWPWEDRSEIVKELYSDLNIIWGSGGSTVMCGNVLYLLFFGWWLLLLYVLVAAVMFVTVVGAHYGWLCWDLAGYFLWPLGKVIQKVEVMLSPDPTRHWVRARPAGRQAAWGRTQPCLVAPCHATFTLALLSIMPLSYYIGMAIASIYAQSNFAVGVVVNATFGSITELTFYITALIKGSREGNRCYAEIVELALTGTLVGCILFVPGLCMVIGGIWHQEQWFNSCSAGVSSALLFLSVGDVFAPTLFSKVYGKLVCGECHNVTQNPLGHYLCHNCHFDLMENNGTLYYSHVQPLVYTVSILLPAAYLIGLFFTLKTHSHIYDIHISDCHMPGHHHSAVVHWSRWRALVILLLSTLCMSACADLAMEHISPILTNSTILQYFIAVTVLAMVPELPEIVNSIQFALQNNLSLSIKIGNCIAVQVCMLQIPILVLFIFYPTNFTLVFSDLHVYATMFSLVLMNYIFMDGKCDYFQGTVLVMVYFILLAVYFFAPSPSGC